MKIKDFLTEKNWGKILYAQDENGVGLDWDDSRACKFCIYGAAMRIYGMNNSEKYDLKIKKAIDKLYPEKRKEAESKGLNVIVHFNDSKDVMFDDVKKILEEADV